MINYIWKSTKLAGCQGAKTSETTGIVFWKPFIGDAREGCCSFEFDAVLPLDERTYHHMFK